MGYRPGGPYVPPTWTTRVTVRIIVTDQNVTVMAFDEPVDNRPGALLWRRGFDRPDGKSEADCVTAAVHATSSGLAGWVNTIGATDVPLDDLEW